MKAIIQGAEAAPQILSGWESMYHDILEDPPSYVTEIIGEKFLPLTDFAIEGLTDEDSQALLERVQRLHQGIQ